MIFLWPWYGLLPSISNPYMVTVSSQVTFMTTSCRFKCVPQILGLLSIDIFNPLFLLITHSFQCIYRRDSVLPKIAKSANIFSFVNRRQKISRDSASYADVLTGSSRNHSSPRTSALTSIHFRSGELANHWPFAIFCKMGLWPQLHFAGTCKHGEHRFGFQSCVLEILYLGVKCPSERSYNPIRGEAERCFY